MTNAPKIFPYFFGGEGGQVKPFSNSPQSEFHCDLYVACNLQHEEQQKKRNRTEEKPEKKKTQIYKLNYSGALVQGSVLQKNKFTKSAQKKNKVHFPIAEPEGARNLPSRILLGHQI